MIDSPYLSSRKFKPDRPWYDSFAKGGKIVWIVHVGARMICEVQNEQQAKNVVEIADERRIFRERDLATLQRREPEL